MRKSRHCVYEAFSEEYKKINKELGKKQYLVPYYISCHPGSTLNDAIETALYLKKTGFVPEQVQDFYPTPGSLSTCMYWRLHRALLQFNKKENKSLVLEALRLAGRMDLAPVLLKR